MKKLLILLFLFIFSGFSNAEHCHWLPTTEELLWTQSDNWSCSLPPDSDDFAWINAANSPCIVDTVADVTYFKVGDNASGELIIKDGGSLSTGDWAFNGDGSTGVGTVTVETGGTLNTGGHFWTGHSPGSVGYTYLEGGTINISGQLGLGWDGGTGYMFVNDGVLNLSNWSTQTISGDSVMNITEGTVVIDGDRRSDIQAVISSDKLIAYDGKGEIEYDYDVTNSGKTTVTATLPMAGDIVDGDEDVDIWDLQEFVNNWLADDCNSKANFVDSCRVNLKDFSALASNWLKGIRYTRNPFITHMYTADPSARVWDNGRLYVYASHDIAPPQGCDLMDKYHVFSTDDMVNWHDHGEILSSDDVPWGREEGGFMWAPDCAYKNGTYYFYFPHPSDSDWNDSWKIGVATSDKPASGFEVQGYIEGLEPLIDPAVFIDDNGQAYFYYGGGGVCKGGRLKDNMMEIEGEMQDMEGLYDFHEAAWVHKRGDTYYLSYSDNYANEEEDKYNRMRYATSDNPLGPWEHQGIYIDSTSSYTNHGSIVKYKGRWYAFYHNSALSGHHWLRSVCVDRLYYNEDGTIRKVIKTETGPEPIPETEE